MSTKKRQIATLAACVVATQALALNALAQSSATRQTTPPADTSRAGSGSSMPSAGSSSDRGSMKDNAHDMDHDAMKSDSGSAMKPVTAQSFANQVATIDKAEIEIGQLAIKNSKDPAVRKYAERMIKDHTATSAKLKTIAAKDNLALPQALDPEHAALKAKLAGLQGQDFDKEYSKAMDKGHDKALALFESASQTPQISGDLKEFAAATLPALREHKEMAHDLHAKEGA